MNFSEKIKRELFQAVAMSVLLYSYTIWAVTELPGEKSYVETTLFVLF